MITRSDIATSLQYGVKVGFLEGKEAYQSQRAAFTKETGSTGKSEKYVGLGEHPMPRPLLDEITPVDLSERSIEITNADWEISIEVEDNAINDDRVGHVLDWARSAGEAFERHMDKLSFQALNAGDASTYGLGYDGLVLFSASHVDSGAGATYTTVQANVGSLALTWDNFNTEYVAMLNFLDARGEPANIVPDLLVVPPAYKSMAAQICQNSEKAGTANRDINPFAGEMRYIVSPFLDSGAWILVASSYVDKPIIFQTRQAPELELIRKGERFSTIYAWKARYQVGYGNWRLAFMGHS